MKNLDKLMELLNQQKQLYSDVLEVSKKKTEIIVGANVQELVNITEIEQTLILKMGKLESQFENVMLDFKTQLSIGDDKINLSKIIEGLKEPEKKKLDTLRNDIYDIIKELDTNNKHNSALIKNSLDYINYSINLFSNSNSGSSAGYAISGDIQVNKKNFFDKKL